MKFRTAILLLLCLGALPAVAQPVLRWAPADTTVDSGQEATLALMLDDTLTVRTLEFFIEYDADILSTGPPPASGMVTAWSWVRTTGPWARVSFSPGRCAPARPAPPNWRP
jgi:hypothetical protein